MIKRLNQSADKFKMEGIDTVVDDALILLEEFRLDNILQEKSNPSKAKKTSKKKYRNVRKKAKKDYGIQVKKVDDEKTTVDKANKKIDNIEKNALTNKDVQKFPKRKQNIQDDANDAEADVKKEDQENKKEGGQEDPKLAKAKKRTKSKVKQVVYKATKHPGKYLVKNDKIGKEHFPDKAISPLKKTSPQDLAVGSGIAEANLLERWAKLAGILKD